MTATDEPTTGHEHEYGPALGDPSVLICECGELGHDTCG